MSIPCTKTRAIPWNNIPGKSNFIITSPTVARLAKGDPGLLRVLKSSVSHTFGDQTKEKLESLGIEVKLYKAQSGFELCQHLDPSQTYTFLGPESPAIDYATTLQERGSQCKMVPLYKTLPESHLDQPDQKILLKDFKGIVSFASPSAVDGFFKSFPSDFGQRQDVWAAVIGDTTRQACEPSFKVVHKAKRQSIESLAKLCQDLLKGIS